MLESQLEDIAQMTGVIDYNDAWAINGKADTDKAYRKKIRSLIGDWEDCMADDDTDGATKVAEKIKALIP